MARLSLWKDGRHTNDYKFMDRRISEIFTISGTGVLVHKYLGTHTDGEKITVTEDTEVSDTTIPTLDGEQVVTRIPVSDTSKINIGDVISGPGIPGCAKVIAKDKDSITIDNGITLPLPEGTQLSVTVDPSKPNYLNDSAMNIQDLLFLENRNRKYDPDVYKMRGIYQVTDSDFDLSQFGLFLSVGTLFMVFHLNDMIDILGRKIMNGDVLELQHLMDYDVMVEEDIPTALKRFYVVSDCSRASEGYGPHWWPHLWRCKLNPLVDSQEYKDILDNIMVDTDGDGVPDKKVGNELSNIDFLYKINDAVICQANSDVPRSGYDTSSFYIRPLENNDPCGYPVNNFSDLTADNDNIDASNIGHTVDSEPNKPTHTIHQYLTGDGLAPNGWPVVVGVAFPTEPREGDYCLRTDYEPKRLFRFTNNRWKYIEDVQRTIIGQDPRNDTQLGTFIHNDKTYTTYDSDDNPMVQPERQSISKILRPKAD